MKNNRIYLSPPHTSTGSVQAWEIKIERISLMPVLSSRIYRRAFDSNWIGPLGHHVNGFENVPIKKCLSCRNFRRKYPVSSNFSDTITPAGIKRNVFQSFFFPFNRVLASRTCFGGNTKGYKITTIYRQINNKARISDPLFLTSAS